MDALSLLRQQRREIEELFQQFEAADDALEKQTIFAQLADTLAVHGTVEEQIFHPAIFMEETQNPIACVYDAQIRVKGLLIEAVVRMGKADFDECVRDMKEAVLRQAAEEENVLFKQVRCVVDARALEVLGQMMEVETAVLTARCASHRRTKRAKLN